MSTSTPNTSINLSSTTATQSSIVHPKTKKVITKSTSASVSGSSKGAAVGSEVVVVQSNFDGFYYEGLKKTQSQGAGAGRSGKNHQVHIPATNESLKTKNIIYINGAIARPQLHINDLVLCKHQMTISDRPDLVAGRVSLDQGGSATSGTGRMPSSGSNKLWYYLPALVLDVNKKHITVFVMEKHIKIVNRTSCVRVGRQTYVDAVIKVQNFYTYGPGRKIKCKFTPAEPKKKISTIRAKNNKKRDQKLKTHNEMILQNEIMTSNLLEEQKNMQAAVKIQQDAFSQDRGKEAGR